MDKIGVFVSIVATKIPFKGTGKEYIGDDIEEIAVAVKHAIQQCCLQLKNKLSKEADLKSRLERKQNLTKYIPAVAKSIFSVLEGVTSSAQILDSSLDISCGGGVGADQPAHRSSSKVQAILEGIASKRVTIKELSAKLVRHVEEEDAAQALDVVRETTMKKSASETVVVPELTREMCSKLVAGTIGSGEANLPIINVLFFPNQ